MRSHIFILLLSLVLLGNKNRLSEKEKDPLMEEFSGRISKINIKGKVARVKVNFENIKYLNKKDIVYVGSKDVSDFRCEGYVLGKSSDYLLLKIPNIDFCSKHVFLTEGSYLNFFSRDLGKNLKIGKELIKVLLKKQMALKGRLTTHQSELSTHMEKVDTVNKRYELLREKLEAEWRKELLALEEDKIQSVRNIKGIELRLNEVEYKLEKYHVRDKNLTLDRWALDPKQYILK